MKELKRRGILCTCLSGDGGDKDGGLAGKLYAFIILPVNCVDNNFYRAGACFCLRTPF